MLIKLTAVVILSVILSKIADIFLNKTREKCFKSVIQIQGENTMSKKAPKTPKVELKILNELVANLNNDLERLNALQDIPSEQKVVEISKLMGIAYGITQEATMLIKDFSALSAMVSTPSAGKMDFDMELFSPSAKSDKGKN